jgi:Arc/MetJ family transcription regulator
MRTNIEIDDRLMKQAMKATGAETKKAAVEAALRKVVQLKKQEGIRKLRGKVVWRGHDDDWFASDEEILEKRRRAKQGEEPANAHLPVTEQQPAIAGEVR